MRSSWKLSLSQTVRRNKFLLIGFCFGFFLASLLKPIWQHCSDSQHSIPTHSDEFSSISGDDILARHYFNWYNDVLTGDYEPVIRNDTKSSQNSELIQPKFAQESALIRDKKLKFFRPRFHYNELKIKSRLLLTVVITKESILEQFQEQSANFVSGFGVKDYRKIIQDFIKKSTTEAFDDFQDDILFFYPQFLNNTHFSDNIIVQRDSSVQVIHLEFKQEDNGPELVHRLVIEHLLKEGLFELYGFTFIFKDSTWISQKNLLKFLHNLTVTDSVISVSNGISLVPDFDFLQDNLLKSDKIFNNGLLISSNLAIRCQLIADCYLNVFQTFNELNQTESLDDNHVFWHQATFLQKDNTFEQMLQNDRDKLTHSLSVYPVKPNSKHESALNMMTFWDEIQRTQSSINIIESRLSDSSSEEGSECPKFWPLSVIDPTRPQSRYEVIAWERWNRSHFFMPTEFRSIRELNQMESLEAAEVEAIVRQKLNDESLNLNWIYRKFDAVRGFEYLVDTPTSRIHIIKALNSLEVIDNIIFPTVNIELIIVVPIRGTAQTGSGVEFLNNYVNSVVLKDANHQSSLIFALIFHPKGESFEEFENLKKSALYAQNKFGVKIGFVDIALPEIVSKDNQPTFPVSLVHLDLIARSLATTSGSKLVLHSRPEMLFTIDLLNRVRLHTLSGRQMFSMIPFQEYQLRNFHNNTEFCRILRNSQNLTSTVEELKNNGGKSVFDVRKENGIFDSANYAFLSFYVEDYLAARKRSSSSLPPFVRSLTLLSRSPELYFNPENDIKSFIQSITKPFKVMRTVEPELRLTDKSVQFGANGNAYSLASKQKLAAIATEHSRRKQN